MNALSLLRIAQDEKGINTNSKFVSDLNNLQVLVHQCFIDISLLDYQHLTIDELVKLLLKDASPDTIVELMKVLFILFVLMHYQTRIQNLFDDKKIPIGNCKFF